MFLILNWWSYPCWPLGTCWELSTTCKNRSIIWNRFRLIIRLNPLGFSSSGSVVQCTLKDPISSRSTRINIARNAFISSAVTLYHCFSVALSVFSGLDWNWWKYLLVSVVTLSMKSSGNVCLKKSTGLNSSVFILGFPGSTHWYGGSQSIWSSTFSLQTLFRGAVLLVRSHLVVALPACVLLWPFVECWHCQMAGLSWVAARVPGYLPARAGFLGKKTGFRVF